MKENHYSYSTLLWFVTTIYQGQDRIMHQGRVKALAFLLQGLLVLRQATLSGMGRGVAVANPDMTFIGQLQRAYRFIKNPEWDGWESAAALLAYATQHLTRVLISVDWTDMGVYKVLEASLVVDGRAIPFYCLTVHREELKGRQTTLELTMWYALAAMRQDGQVLVVMADRGFAKFDWIGPCPHYPWMPVVIRLKANTILTWGTVSGPLREWPLWPGEIVEIEEAHLGVEHQVVSGVCLANLGAGQGRPLYLACAKPDCPMAVDEYAKRAWIEQQNRDIKSGHQMTKAHLSRADRLERLWVIVGMAFYISYCHEAAHQSQFARRISRRYKDGRKDLSWMSLAKYAHLSGRSDWLLRPLSAQ